MATDRRIACAGSGCMSCAVSFHRVSVKAEFSRTNPNVCHRFTRVLHEILQVRVFATANCQNESVCFRGSQFRCVCLMRVFCVREFGVIKYYSTIINLYLIICSITRCIS